ncbi:Cytochrome c [Stieleria bergensis]|uniref:Cytochrome c n=2 Tax=Stieleria bergensis TaxID=2528025 RepID=A0A517SS40_9BACT|nr:Cytochrome c [Planctomycetes bacterium SV_7m_r]
MAGSCLTPKVLSHGSKAIDFNGLITECADGSPHQRHRADSVPSPVPSLRSGRLAGSHRFIHSQLGSALLCCAAIVVGMFVATSMASAEEQSQWIWRFGASPEDSIPVGEQCFFRKSINLRVPATVKIEIAADDEYELFVNGTRVGSSVQSRTVDSYNATKHFQVGRNLVAIRVRNRNGDTAALAASVAVKPEKSSKWYTFRTDPSWKTSPTATQGWQAPVYDDQLWGIAATFGAPEEQTPQQVATATPKPIQNATPQNGSPAALNDGQAASRPGLPTPPEDPSKIPSRNEPTMTPPNGQGDAGNFAENTPVPQPHAAAGERFQIQKGFGIQRILSDDKVGSVISMTFNEFGHLLIGQEDGPLLLAYDDNDDGVPETVRVYCEKVTNCQGVLALNGEVFVTADGPEGLALYKLSDADRNGSLEKIQAIVNFVDHSGKTGQTSEYGAHGIKLGPDGMIYVVVGSQVKAVGEVGDGQTYRQTYEGDLLPRYEDPSGHGKDVLAPGGTVIRTNSDGTVVEHVAGGLRNAYDIVFHPGGAMFVHDSDMESDVDTAWYRSSAVFDVTEGGEFGWRSGWAKWPHYYYDRLPNLMDTGRGSPTGGVCYDHFTFPERYQNTMFLADWSQGRIINVGLKPLGSSYTATSEVFLQGQPLNVTDVEVGPEGNLFFCTGGRSTTGGIYRVVYKDGEPTDLTKLGTGIAEAVRQPQLESAWTRQKIASIKNDLGDRWNPLVAGVAYSSDNPPEYRVRAMTLMQLFGPVPSEDLLLELSETESELVRAKAASMLGRNPGPLGRSRLAELLQDRSPVVQRAAAEAMLRGQVVPKEYEVVRELISGGDRTLAFIGRRLVASMPADKFAENVLEATNVRESLVGMLALTDVDQTEQTAVRILQRSSELMSGFLSDADFVDLLRLCQVTLHRSGLDSTHVTAFGEQIAEEFPAGEPRINHEVIRLAAYMQSESVADRAIKYLESEAPYESRILVAMCLQSMSHTWNDKQRFSLLKFYEKSANRSTSGALPMYITNVTRDFCSALSVDDLQAIIEQGHIWQNAALAAIYRLDRPVSGEVASILVRLDRRLRNEKQPRDIQRRLRTAIVTMLASTDQAESTEYLRELWREEPQRRSRVSVALAQNPEGDNWDYLVRSLNVVDDDAAREVVSALLKVNVATDDPLALRHLILLGLRNQEDDHRPDNVTKLLRHWTGKQHAPTDDVMKPWQDWYAEIYPDSPPATLPPRDESTWDFDQLVSYLKSPEGRSGDPTRGRSLFLAANCAQCHRTGAVGESIGPDLTGLASRFTKREIVESILHPNHVVSDQFASKRVVTLDGKVYIGLVTEQADGTLLVRDSRNDATVVPVAEVDQILPETRSIMPSGLIDALNERDVSDLMSFIGVLPAAEVATRP